MTKIFLDSDGVAADMDTYIDTHVPHIRGVDDAEFWHELSLIPHLFSQFKPYTDFQCVIDVCLSRGHDLEWLTATPKPTKYLCTAGNDKREFLAKHFTKIPCSTVDGGRNKAQFLHVYPGAVLIDDYQRNITMWNEAGGIGILHNHRDVDATLSALQHHGLL